MLKVLAILLFVMFVQACAEQAGLLPTAALESQHAGFYSIAHAPAAMPPDTADSSRDELDLKIAGDMLFVRMFVQPQAGEQCFINGSAERQGDLFVYSDVTNGCVFQIALVDDAVVIATQGQANCARSCQQQTGFATAVFPLASRWISAAPSEEISCY
jgi:hypothetical protein